MTKAVHAGGRLFCVEHIKKVFDVTVMFDKQNPKN